MIKKTYKKIIKITQMSIFKLKYRIKAFNIECNQSLFSLNKDERNEEIIVSLTSFPMRFNTLHLVIKSILYQTMKPDMVILYLDNTVKYNELPKSIIDLIKFGLQIEFRPENIKPHKKYYYAMKEHPNSIVITIDDDILYPKKLIKELYNTHQLYERCVISARSHKIIFDNNGIKSYNEWEWMSSIVNTPSMELIATGCGGVLYPPHCMSKELFNLELLKKLSLNQDDLWLKVMQVRVGTPVVNCNQKLRKKRVLIDGSQEISLNSSNVHDNTNDIYMKNLIDYFDLKKENFTR